MSSKRVKSVDMAKDSLTRMPSRTGGLSIVSRFTMAEKPRTPRTQRFAHYSRHGTRYLRAQQTDFKIRTSVADLVMKELDTFERCIFYQRVYILAKNNLLTVSVDSSHDSILSQYMQSKTSQMSVSGDAHVEAAGEELATDMEEMSQAPQEMETANLETTTLPIEAKSSQEEFRASLLKVTGADMEVATVVKERRFLELNFFDQFKPRLEDIVRQVDAEQLSEDSFSGLLLCMGNSSTLLVLEGTEDTIANFCQELLKISNEFFEVLRVFMVEDRIEETYFEDFIYRRAPAMNITEKFPANTANDSYMMGPQHWLIKEKLHTICRTLSYELKPPALSEIMEIAPQPTIVIIEEEKKEPKKRRIVKRKKSPKRKKAAAATAVAQPAATDAAAARSQKDDGEGEEEEGSVTKLSLASASSKQQLSQAPTETELPEAEAVVEEQPEPLTEQPPPSAVEEEAPILKESSLKPFTFEEKEMDTALPEEEDADLEPLELLSDYALSPAIYNRLLPEIQRIELVLTSKRFYLDLADFLAFSQQIPMQADEDALLWPTQYNYMPLNVFQRLPFDVNLTFGSYDVKEGESEEDSSDDEEKKEDGEEGEEGGGGGEKKKEEAG